MKILVAYGSKYGCTEKCAKLLSDQINRDHDVVLVDHKMSEPANLEEFDWVVIGGPIYMGKTLPEIVAFINHNLPELLTKKIGLFICAADLDKVVEQSQLVFDPELTRHAKAIEHFGYELSLEKMDIISKMIIRMVARVKENQYNIFTENIEKFAAMILNSN
ncbi:MAG: flavodoxin [Firmicutes bacterium]|nr:flavodoxin [Bacillota bacterium]